MGARRAPRIADADRPSWPIMVSAAGTAYLLADAVKVISTPEFLDGIVFGVSAAMLVLTFTIAPHRQAYEQHLSESTCIHRREQDWDDEEDF